MKRINLLNSKIANMIAAGEVVERPSSVVKELVENSIDSGANHICVEIKKGGIAYIRLTDNGMGINKQDAVLAFKRHATSKISKVSDLNNIMTLGFRGEALASIAAVSHVEMITKTIDSCEGIHVTVRAGKIVNTEDIGCPNGTTIIVKSLFYNTPARMKFLKKDSTEAAYVGDIVSKAALSHPEISFKYINNGKEIFFTSGDNKILSSVYSIYGRNYAKSMLHIDNNVENINVFGVIGKPDISRPKRNMEIFFVNSRYVKNKTLTLAVEEAYKNVLMINKFPVVVLNININPSLVDVNVHPSKIEIKFSNEKQVYNSVYWAVKNKLYSQKITPEIHIEYNSQKPAEPDKYVQEEIEINKAVPIESNNIIKQDDVIIKKNDKIIKENEDKYVIKKNFKIIGQIWESYILVEKGDKLLFIDQHAAHERLKYEELLKKKNSLQSFSQVLLVPLIIQLTNIEVDVVNQNIDFFKNIGFEVQDFGNNSIIISEAPIFAEEAIIKDLFLDVLGMLQDDKKQSISDLEYKALYTAACKSALKANRSLHVKEIEKLIEDLQELGNINTCPHGRPIMITLSKYQMEKRFGRIQ